MLKNYARLSKIRHRIPTFEDYKESHWEDTLKIHKNLTNALSEVLQRLKEYGPGNIFASRHADLYDDDPELFYYPGGKNSQPFIYHIGSGVDELNKNMVKMAITYYDGECVNCECVGDSEFVVAKCNNRKSLTELKVGWKRGYAHNGRFV